MNRLLFLCTGNYYRSRFCEFYFRHQAALRGLDWSVDSRGLALSTNNVGPLSIYTADACGLLGISCDPLRLPEWLSETDLRQATCTIAVKEAEHRPLMHQNFPAWENRIEYWHVDDLDCAPAEKALVELRHLVDRLIEQFATEQFATEA